MMTADPWTSRLSEYLDGELDAADRNALEAHLHACAHCRDALEDLRAITSAAGRLEDRPPTTDLWPTIAARIGAGTAPARATWRFRPGARLRSFLDAGLRQPRLAAAALALALAAGALWIARPDRIASGPPPAPAPRPIAAPAPAPRNGGAVRFVTDDGAAGYDAAIADLQRVLAERRDELDPATVRVLERNLEIIDRAIEDARRAVAADPGKRYLNRHLVDSMQRKLELLRHATRIVRAQS
ncbi:MAG TPA: zf-HC2 domain-containing protein [Longimicrobiales bacterium]